MAFRRFSEVATLSWSPFCDLYCMVDDIKSMSVDEKMERASKNPKVARSPLVQSCAIIELDVRAALTQASDRPSTRAGSGRGLAEYSIFDALWQALKHRKKMGLVVSMTHCVAESV
jgi:hypothetical protein